MHDVHEGCGRCSVFFEEDGDGFACGGYVFGFEVPGGIPGAVSVC